MKIIAPEKIKIKFIFAFVLLGIFSVLAIGTHFIEKNAAVDASGVKISHTVIIDAGHGGVDGGTSAGDGTLEKDLNLQIALKLNGILQAMNIDTVMIRTEDISIHDKSAETIRQKKVSDLKNRLSIINNTDNAIFVSIHQNHFSSPEYSGAQVFYSKNNSHSIKLADKIRDKFVSYCQPDNTREIKQSGNEIYLLRHAQAPAVMVECGFLSNTAEAEKLKNSNYQHALAFTVAMGISDYINSSEEI